jgi:two-component system, LytTR family, sensor kinase
MERNGSRAQRWFWIAAIWLGFGLVDATQTVLMMHSEGMHHAWVKLFAKSVLSWVPWMVATPLVMELERRLSPVRLRSWKTWVVHLVACGVVGLAYSAWAALLVRVMKPYANSSDATPFVRLTFENFFNGVLAFVILYGAIVAVSYVLDSRARLARQETETARLNEQLSKAQLNALRRQIEPHFLFNTLNAVSALVREGRSDAAVKTIAGLSDFLRRVLEDSSRQEVPLSEEMEFTQRYLEIQKVRFVERLQLSVDVPHELLVAQVPTLILQLMVENAIKHGIAKRAHGGKVKIAASRAEDRLTLSVYNDGPNVPVSWEKVQSGVGISNMRTRLKSLYGDAFDLHMENRPQGGVEVSVSVPFRELRAG